LPNDSNDLRKFCALSRATFAVGGKNSPLAQFDPPCRRLDSKLSISDFQKMSVILALFSLHLVELFVLGLVYREIQNLKRQETKQMQELIDQAKKNEDAEDAAATLLGQLKSRLDTAIASNDPAQLKQLSTDLGTHQGALAAAIVANTPAA